MRTKKLALPFLFLIVLSVFSSMLIASAQSSSLTLTITQTASGVSGVMGYDKYDPITLSGNLQYGSGSPGNALIGVEVDFPSQGGPMVLRTVLTGTTAPTGVPEEITSAYPTSTFMGAETNSFGNGTEAYFAATVTDQDSQVHNNMVLSVTIFDGNGVPLGVGQSPLSVGAGATQPAYVSIPIPASAHLGTAYGYADLYSALPSSNGIPMAQEQSFQFTITGTSNPSSGPAPTSSSPTAGAYSLSFRIPKACLDGAYKVYASTSYGGQTATAQTGFNVWLIGDFNLAGSVTGEDLFLFAAAYINYWNGQNYNKLCDITGAGEVDSTDFFLFVAAYIQWWSP